MGRANVLRSVQAVLSSFQPLAEFLGHVPEAESVGEGARIIGDTSRLELNGVMPIIILSFTDSEGLAPQREDKSWETEAFIYSEDIFEAAEIVDLVERACLEYRRDPTLPQPLNQIKPGAAERVASERNTGYILEFRQPLTVRWVEAPEVPPERVQSPPPSPPSSPPKSEPQHGAYRVYRLNVTNAVGNARHFGLREIELYDAAGVNRAPDARLSSSFPNWRDSQPLSALNDGDPDTKAFAFSGSQPISVTLTFGEALEVARLGLVGFGGLEQDSGTYSPSTFTLEASDDGDTFTTLVTESGLAQDDWWAENRRRIYALPVLPKG